MDSSKSEFGKNQLQDPEHQVLKLMETNST